MASQLLDIIMNFLKEGKEYWEEELRGGISNYFNFSIKDLYKKDAHRVAMMELPVC